VAEDTYPFPDDEFDELGRQRVPQGVHRAPRPWWRVWGPLIAVVVLAPLLAWGLVRIAAGGGDDGAAPTTPSITATDGTPTDAATDGTEPAPEESTGAGEGETSEEPTPEETATEPEPEPVDRAVAVSVLNGASVQGLAGRTQEKLAGLGWSNITSGNYQSAQPEVSTVFFRDESLRAAAEAVASELGIAQVSELADVASITVVLRSDFAE